LKNAGAFDYPLAPLEFVLSVAEQPDWSRTVEPDLDDTLLKHFAVLPADWFEFLSERQVALSAAELTVA